MGSLVPQLPLPCLGLPTPFPSANHTPSPPVRHLSHFSKWPQTQMSSLTLLFFSSAPLSPLVGSGHYECKSPNASSFPMHSPLNVSFELAHSAPPPTPLGQAAVIPTGQAPVPVHCPPRLYQHPMHGCWGAPGCVGGGRAILRLLSMHSPTVTDLREPGLDCSLPDPEFQLQEAK